MAKLTTVIQLALLLIIFSILLGGGVIYAEGDPGPQASTALATSIGTNSATLNGVVFANGATTTVTFDYGTSVNYEYTTVSAIPSTVSGDTLTYVPVYLPVSNLTDNTLYHFRVVAENDLGTAIGQDLTFFIGIGEAPVATTTIASSVTLTGATLNGTVMPGGINTVAGFQYGPTTSYGSTVLADQSPLGGLSASAITKTLTELQGGVTYNYRAVATNTHGTSYGYNSTFTIEVTPPSVTTEEASSVSSSSAILNGSVDAFANSTIVTFEYGPDQKYGSVITADQSPLSGSGSIPVTATLSPLPNGATYHYRVVGQNDGGTSNGDNKLFTTSVNGPLAITENATSVSHKSAVLNGTVNANNNTTAVSINFGNSLPFGRSIPATPASVSGDGNTAISAQVSGLAPGHTYYFQIVATNSGGSSYGSIFSFTTSTKKEFPWPLFLNGFKEKN